MKSIQIEIKWALIFTIVGLLWMVLEKLVGLHDTYIDYHIYLTNLFAIPAIVMMVLALKDKKKNFFGGEMSYKQGMKSGILLSIFIGFLSPLAQWVTTNVITPDYFPNVIQRSVELGYYATTADAEAQFNYQNYAIQGALGAIVMGFITTAIVMIFIRSKNS
ncbi:DUF4199 domain-containing protein [Planktosalinus lacus]|uniref:DUF4199 domain-containing protein n=1 Tax=Planktosalinus lacus TaxID=1526573 RepID=A0A8J2VAN1_9FLAO|nr:DUF4199 domain-containing protein [Planktosalinus lacus]GGD93886.1 hypothetical protein GCM10011312_17020 [Planktosalinus lacus]